MILAIIQARMSSRRLPGKVLMPLADEPMLLRQYQRVSRCQILDEIVIATSDEASDQPIVDTCNDKNMAVFAGDLTNVLKRFFDCANHYQPQHIVRLTADCPFSDSGLIDKVVTQHLVTGADYTSNAFPHTYPDGLDVEVFTFDALKSAYENADHVFEQEHVTPYIRTHGDQFQLCSVQAPADFSQHRWTVDYPEDMKLVREIFTALYPKQPNFTWQDVMTFLTTHPHLQAINQCHVEAV